MSKTSFARKLVSCLASAALAAMMLPALGGVALAGPADDKAAAEKALADLHEAEYSDCTVDAKKLKNHFWTNTADPKDATAWAHVVDGVMYIDGTGTFKVAGEKGWIDHFTHATTNTGSEKGTALVVTKIVIGAGIDGIAEGTFKDGEDKGKTVENPFKALNGWTKGSSLPKLADGYAVQLACTHTDETLTRHEAVAATCVKGGSIEYYECDVCKAKFTKGADGAYTAVTETATPVDTVNGHSWGTATYAWETPDGIMICYASRTCTRTGCSEKDHAEARATSTVKEPTCTRKGTTTYTATFKEDWASTQTKVVETDALGHSYYWETLDNGRHGLVCYRCGDVDSSHDPVWDYDKVVMEDGTAYMHCVKCGLYAPYEKPSKGHGAAYEDESGKRQGDVADATSASGADLYDLIAVTSVKGVAKNVKKGKSASFKLATVTSKSGKSVTYFKVSGNAKIAVSKGGKVTVKKGLKKGAYTVKVKAVCGIYTKVVTVKVKVK